jgi:flagellar hook-length control protein FliK
MLQATNPVPTYIPGAAARTSGSPKISDPHSDRFEDVLEEKISDPSEDKSDTENLACQAASQMQTVTQPTNNPPASTPAAGQEEPACAAVTVVNGQELAGAVEVKQALASGVSVNAAGAEPSADASASVNAAGTQSPLSEGTPVNVAGTSSSQAQTAAEGTQLPATAFPTAEAGKTAQEAADTGLNPQNGEAGPETPIVEGLATNQVVVEMVASEAESAAKLTKAVPPFAEPQNKDVPLGDAALKTAPKQPASNIHKPEIEVVPAGSPAEPGSVLRPAESTAVQPQTDSQAKNELAAQQKAAVAPPPAGGTFTAQNLPGVQVKTMEARGQEMASQIAQQVEMAASQGRSTLRIQLYPEDLGRIDLRLTHSAQGLMVTMVADRASTGQALSDQADLLRQALSEAGIQLSNLNINQQGSQQNNQNGWQPPQTNPQLFRPQTQKEASIQQNLTEGTQVSSSGIDYRI